MDGGGESQEQNYETRVCLEFMKMENVVRRGRFPSKRTSAAAYGVSIVQKCIGQTKTPYDKH